MKVWLGAIFWLMFVTKVFKFRVLLPKYYSEKNKIGISGVYPPLSYKFHHSFIFGGKGVIDNVWCQTACTKRVRQKPLHHDPTPPVRVRCVPSNDLITACYVRGGYPLRILPLGTPEYDRKSSKSWPPDLSICQNVQQLAPKPAGATIASLFLTFIWVFDEILFRKIRNNHKFAGKFD